MSSLEDLFKGPPIPNKEYRELPKQKPRYDYSAILKSVPKGQHRVIPYEKGVQVLTLRFAIERLEKEGKISKGEYRSRSRKRPDGKEDTIVWHE
jgi:hypothetical protein